MASLNPLRVWPGVVAVALQWLSRFGIKALIPGIKGFGRGIMVSFVFTIALVGATPDQFNERYSFG